MLVTCECCSILFAISRIIPVTEIFLRFSLIVLLVFFNLFIFFYDVLLMFIPTGYIYNFCTALLLNEGVNFV